MRALVVLLAAGVLLAGCAEVACRDPQTVVVTDKRDDMRVETRVIDTRVEPSGRVREQREQFVIHDYLVKDPSDRWYRVPEPTWRAAKIGDSVTVCR
ncbi:MAG: hypothetical protein HYR86_01630 [Candidatus Rokubacteria bacterium]|nr:hypothetical protein [Candidatus Rokubacteria bacterium]